MSVLVLMLCAAAPFQYSFTLWDWDANYRDMGRFRETVDACAAHGFTLIELGVGWTDCEKEEEQYDFSLVEERARYITEKGLGIRLRVNVCRWPDWVQPEVFALPDGTPFDYWRGVPSVFNMDNRRRQMRFVGALATHFAGRGFTYTPGFSVHMEVKFADWNSYEESAKKDFRAFLAHNYGDVTALNAAWGTQLGSFDEAQPPVPAGTNGEPSRDRASDDWIRFRENGLVDWVELFDKTVRNHDPSARVSVPLGESYRAGSAQMANLAYWRYARLADEVVHSYDFFLHGPKDLRRARLAAAIMTGITQKPVIFEVDGPVLLEKFGYAEDDLVECARLALKGGAAGIQVSNWGSTQGLRERRFLSEIGALVRAASAGGEWRPPQQAPALYYVSKWQNYRFREPSEWVYGRQFELWHRLADEGEPVRIVTDENVLYEDLRPEVVYAPFAREVEPNVQERLRGFDARFVESRQP